MTTTPADVTRMTRSKRALMIALLPAQNEALALGLKVSTTWTTSGRLSVVVEVRHALGEEEDGYAEPGAGYQGDPTGRVLLTLRTTEREPRYGSSFRGNIGTARVSLAEPVYVWQTRAERRRDFETTAGWDD